MKSQLPIKKTNSFFQRIKQILNRLFKGKNVEQYSEINTELKSKEKNEFEESIKIEINDNISSAKKIDASREEFLDEIENTPELLYDLSIEKLKILENYYKISIKNQEDKLAKMQKAS